jgi:hypothetical protein
MHDPIIRAITDLLIIHVLFEYQFKMYFYMYELTRRVLDFLYSNLQNKCLNNIELIMFFSKKNISIYSTHHGLSEYVKNN